MTVQESVYVGQCREVVPTYFRGYKGLFAVDFFRLSVYNGKWKGEMRMSKTNDYKKIIKAVEKDGWYLIRDNGHKQYKHPVKKGKVTIPHNITKNIVKSVCKQAGLKIV